MRMSRLAVALVGAGLIAASAAAQADGVPPLAEDIERRLEGAFMFTTDTGERYTLYQRVEDRTGLDPGTDVICLMNRCFVQIAEIAAAKLEERSRRAGGLETVRRRFRAARDAYTGVQRAGAAERPGATAEWRSATARLDACLQDDAAC